MSDDGPKDSLAAVSEVYRSESRRVLATLIRLLGDFDVAEEAMHEAFAAAVVQWPRDGVPANPRSWLISVGRFRAVDALRKQIRLNRSVVELGRRLEVESDENADDLEHDLSGTDIAGTPIEPAVDDDRLRLVFTCCHPLLPSEGRVALTLREVCGLTTEEIADAFLVPTPTIAKRIVRAKARIREARISYEIPDRNALPERLDSVLQVVYLVFNEGYSASRGKALTRLDLCAEAIRMGRLLAELLPDPEVLGLLALMLLQDSRKAVRLSPDGEIVLIADQDRSAWDRDEISEGTNLVDRAIASGRVGAYTLQAAIAAVHARARANEATDWPQIVSLYDVLLRVQPSPVVALNRAIAVAERDGPAAGLALLDPIMAEGYLADYHLAHSARADLLRRAGRVEDARAAYRRAFYLTRQEPERRFILRRLAEMTGK